MPFDVSLDDIRQAQAVIAGKVRATPTYASPALSQLLGFETIVKMEALQLHGSFKIRGCLNKLASLNAEELKRGVVTVSGGNHAIAVSAAATRFGTRALVLMPKTASPYNIRLAEAAGGRIELCEGAAEAFAKADSYAAEGMVNVHSYDDPLIIAGHGTVGLEFAEAAPELDHLFVSIGGGGFIAGVAAAFKALSPGTQIHGVETEGADAMSQALAAGQPVTIRPTSIARTLGAPFATARTLAAAQELLNEVIRVPDEAAVSDLLAILEAERILVEPAAACVLSAARMRAASFRPGARIGLVLCGSTVPLSDVTGWRQQFGL